MNICLFTSEEIGTPLSTRDERGQHLIKVLHKKEGETFSAVFFAFILIIRISKCFKTLFIPSRDD